MSAIVAGPLKMTSLLRAFAISPAASAVADAATSVLAIVGLFGGWFYGWAWLDPAMGIVGAVLIVGAIGVAALARLRAGRA